MTEDEKLRQSARFHEAGHAVVAAHLRNSFDHVTIDPGKLQKGRGGYLLKNGITWGFGIGRWDKVADAYNCFSAETIREKMKRRLLNEATELYAGQVAEYYCLKKCLSDGSEQDERDAIDLVSCHYAVDSLGEEIVLEIPANERDKFLFEARVRAWELMPLPYIHSAILDVQQELAKYMTVSGTRVRQILREKKHTYGKCTASHRAWAKIMAEGQREQLHLETLSAVQA